MKRVTIVGPSGSGKSTLAQELGKLNALPVFHMDQLFFKPGWVEKSRAELAEEVEKILESNEEWIIEGNYSQTLPARIAQSSHVIFLDYPRRVYVYRVLKRLVKTYGRVRKDMAPGCPERIDIAFLKYVWHFKSKRREKLLKIVSAHVTEKNQLLIFKHPKECDRYIRKVRESEND
ncbi:MAG: topology modulation protein [Alkalibacterium sp.]|nr:topology modulation protein [Alkalibacterium sp.]